MSGSSVLVSNIGRRQWLSSSLSSTNLPGTSERDGINKSLHVCLFATYHSCLLMCSFPSHVFHSYLGSRQRPVSTVWFCLLPPPYSNRGRCSKVVFGGAPTQIIWLLFVPLFTAPKSFLEAPLPNSFGNFLYHYLQTKKAQLLSHLLLIKENFNINI